MFLTCNRKKISNFAPQLRFALHVHAQKEGSPCHMRPRKLKVTNKQYK